MCIYIYIYSVHIIHLSPSLSLYTYIYIYIYGPQMNNKASFSAKICRLFGPAFRSGSNLYAVELPHSR